MINKIIRSLLLFGIVFALGASARPAAAGGIINATCSTIQIYITNTVDAEIYYDAANWTTADRRIGWLQPGESHLLTLTPGVIEFWVEKWEVNGTDNWDLDTWVYIPGCSRAAIYVKIVKGEPQLKVKAFLPDAP